MITTKIIPRVSETDGAGHINNTVVPIWFEAGRREIFKILTPDLSFNDWKAVLVNMNVDYLNQIYFNHEVEIKTSIKKIGNTSFVVYEEINQHNKVCAKGTATYVYFDFKTQSSHPIPSDIRKQFEKLKYNEN